jgi:ABC-2 type transport system ATP-binding protein
VGKSVVPSLLKEVGLDDAANRKVGTFSKGMTQLLGIAQAMIGNPSIYIMDEPTGGLDARWVKMVRDKLTTLNEQGATIVFSSHILSEVQALCDRVAIIDKGKLVAEDTIDNISEHMNIRPRLWVRSPNLSSQIPDWIHEIKEIEYVTVKDDTLTITCDSAARMKVMTMLKENGLEIVDFKTIDPSLEDAFVRLLSDRKEGS